MSSTRRNGRARRFTSTTAAAALAFATLPLTATPAAAAHLKDLGLACDNAPDSSLSDADSVSTPAGESDYQWVIDCLNAAAGYTNDAGTPVLTGLSDGSSGFAADATRAQFAGIFNRFAEAAGYDTDETASTPFTDIEGIFFEGDVRAIYAESWTTGKTETTYEPQGNLQVNQLATFFTRMLEDILGAPLETDADARVTEAGFGATHQANGEKLYDNGILTEEQADNGTRTATRGDIFAMMARVLSLSVEKGVVTNPFPVPTNQTLTVGTADAMTKTVSSSATNNDGARSYTASGLDNAMTYDIALFPAENVKVDANGIVTLDPNTQLGDNTGVSIEVVNGASNVAAAAAAGDAHVNAVQPQAGSITFSVDSVVADQVIPVVFQDADNDNTLDAGTDKKPTEGFGIGGKLSWIPVEAATGVTATEAITGVDKDADYFVTTTTYKYDANDVFQIETGATCVNTTMANFEQNLSKGDSLKAGSTYTREVAASSTFCLQDTAPASPTAVATSVAGNDVTVSWAAVTGADSYNVYRQVDSTPATNCEGANSPTAANYTKVGSSTTTSFKDAGVADGTYCYTVTAVAQGDESTPGDGASDEAQAKPPLADVIAPVTLTNGALADVDTGFAGIIDAGDVFVLHFSEPVTLAGNAAVILSDTTNSATVTNGVNSTWAGSGTQMVTITMTATLQSTATGTPSIIHNGPTTITNRSGVTDAAGNAWALTGDSIVEHNGAEILSDTAAVGATTFTITFNEKVTKASAETLANYSYDADGAGATPAAAPTAAVLGADGRTVTLTVAAAVAANATLDITVGITDTDGQASAASSYTL